MNQPPSPTPHSLHLRQIAQRIADACPLPLGDEIALVGGAARGTADANSDLDLDFWVAELPPLEARLAFLSGVGAHDLQVEPEPRADGSQWIAGMLRADDAPLPIEAGWQTHAALAAEIDLLASGDLHDLGRLALAELIVSAYPLRSAPGKHAPHEGIGHDRIAWDGIAQVQARLRGGLPAPTADFLRAHAAVLLTTALPGSEAMEQAHALLWFADQRLWPPKKLKTMRGIMETSSTGA